MCVTERETDRQRETEREREIAGGQHVLGCWGRNPEGYLILALALEGPTAEQKTLA